MAGLEGAKTGKLLYHLTLVDNFRSIVQNGLMSRSLIMEQQIGFGNVADMMIIDRRRDFGLDRYIPFHFHPYSSFDVAVKNTYDAHRMIYLCVSREYARNNGFMVLPMHPLSMESCQLFQYDDGFNMIDWDTLTRKNDNSDYAKEVKMAEALTDSIIYINNFACIFVPSDIIKSEIETIMNEEGIPIDIRPNIIVQHIWFNYSKPF